MRFISPLRSAPGTTSALPRLAESRGGFYPGIFMEPFAGGAGTSIMVVHGLSNSGLLIDQSPAVAAFWRDAIETYELTRKAATFMEMRERTGDMVANLERDPSFWAYIQPHFCSGEDLAGGHSENANSHRSITDLVEFLKQIRVVTGRVRILEGDAWQLLDQYAKDSDEYATLAAPYVECGKFLFDSFTYDQKWLVKILAGWKGRWLFSYDSQSHVVKVVFLRPAASADCSGVAWLRPMSVNSHPSQRQASKVSNR